MSAVTTERVVLRSGDDEIVGTLVLPASRPRGAVVATGPLTSVKEQASGVYARAVAERGWAGLAIDLRRFGESGGEPRQMVDPESDADDASTAAAYLAERFAGLPVAGLGVCFGAGPMAVAVARDRHFAAFDEEEHAGGRDDPGEREPDDHPMTPGESSRTTKSP